MRYTMRMLLVPEEIFNSIAQPQADGTPVGLVRSRMQQIEQDKGMNIDEKAAKYQQEFKRLNKLVREQEERPMDVRVKNLQEIAENLPLERTTKIIKQVHLPKKRGRRAQIKRKEGEEEEWHDASALQLEQTASPSQMELRSSKAGTSTKPPEPASFTFAILQYIRQKAEKFGVNDQGKILRADGGTPFKTSNIEDIVKYLLDRDKRSQFKNAPVGLKEFREKAKGDAFLEQHLFAQQSGKGFEFNKRHKKACKKQFVFKPSIWY